MEKHNHYLRSIVEPDAMIKTDYKNHVNGEENASPSQFRKGSSERAE